MTSHRKILLHFIAHQDEYVDLYPGKYVVIREDFKTAGAFDTREEADVCKASITNMVTGCYRAIPGEDAYTIQLRSL